MDPPFGLRPAMRRDWPRPEMIGMNASLYENMLNSGYAVLNRLSSSF
jgi:hypothetical protein